MSFYTTVDSWGTFVRLEAAVGQRPEGDFEVSVLCVGFRLGAELGCGGLVDRTWSVASVRGVCLKEGTAPSFWEYYLSSQGLDSMCHCGDT